MTNRRLCPRTEDPLQLCHLAGLCVSLQHFLVSAGTPSAVPGHGQSLAALGNLFWSFLPLEVCHKHHARGLRISLTPCMPNVKSCCALHSSSAVRSVTSRDTFAIPLQAYGLCRKPPLRG